MHSLPADALKAACLRLMNVSEMMSQQQIIQPIQASSLKCKQTNKHIRTKQTHSSLKPFKTIHKHLRDNFWWRTNEQMVSKSVAREISWLARNIWCSLQQSRESFSCRAKDVWWFTKHSRENVCWFSNLRKWFYFSRVPLGVHVPNDGMFCVSAFTLFSREICFHQCCRLHLIVYHLFILLVVNFSPSRFHHFVTLH